MDREDIEIVDLGIASVDTLGSDFQVIEPIGLREVAPGISED